jgi:hypothetical protein
MAVYVFRGFDMRNVKWGLGLLISILLVVGCESPLVGLGEKVDITAPTLVVSTPVNGAYVKGTINFSGTFQDDAPGVKVLVSIDGGTTFPFEATTNQAAKTWSLNVDTTDEVTYGPEGEKEFWLKVQDISGKENLYRHLMFFDNKPPTVMVTEPNRINSGLNGNVTIRGEASDSYGLSQVEVEIYNSADNTLVSSTVADGTTSWSTVFDSAAAGTGIYYVNIIATDRSGNENVHFYHFDDVFGLGTGVTVDTLRRVENTESGSDGVTFSELQDEQLTLNLPTSQQMRLNVVQDADLPVFTFSNPTQSGTLESQIEDTNNILSPNAKFIGQITDDDSVQTTGNVPEIRIVQPNGIYTDKSLDEGSVPATHTLIQDWTPVTFTSGSALNWNWSYDHGPTLPDAEYYIQIKAEDIFGSQNISDPAGFKINTGVPVIEIDSHTPGSYINTNSFILEGPTTATNTITDVDVKLGTGAWAPAVYDSGTDRWSYTTPAQADGPLSIQARVIDNVGTPAVFNLQVNIDATDPVGSILSPASTSVVNGVITVRGTTNDASSAVTDVQLLVGKVGSWVSKDSGTNYNWEKQVDTLSFANAIYANETPPGSGIWRLPIQVEVTDTAGNIYTSPADGQPGYYYVDIDNDRDKPETTIDSPVGNMNYGGSVLFVGSAFDDDQIKRVYMQILGHQTDATYDAMALDGTTLATNVDTGAVITTASVLDGSWIDLGSSNRWNQTLNSSGDFYASGNYNGTVTVRVVAVDDEAFKDGAPSVAGVPETLTVTFDDTIPRAELIQIDGVDYAQGAYVNDSFTLTGEASDNSTVTQVEISFNGGVNYPISYTPGAATYNINEVIDTSVINGGIFAGTSGQLSLRIRVTDDSDYRIIRNIDLSVDNLAPVANYDTGAADPVQVSGSNFKIQGDTTDITGGATVGAIDKLEVYIEKDGQIYDPGALLTSAAADTRDPGYGFGAITYPAVAQESYIMTIDDRDEVENDASGGGDGDGFNESLIKDGTNNEWSVAFDSNNIPDGAATFHFITLDRAGNGAHYFKDAFISNNPPVIDSIILGTDLNGDGDSEDADETKVFSSGYATTDFTVRNNYLSITVTSSDGNGTKRYSLDYGGVERNGTLTSNSIEVTNFGSIPDASGNSATFTLKVYDSTTLDDPDDTNELSDTITIGMNIQNTDTVPATIEVAPFGQQYNEDSDDSAKVLSAVADYEDNILMSGDNRLGYVEYATFSSHNGADADISGQVIFKGKAEDNQRIQRITATIPGYNGGAAFDIYTAAGGPLTGADWAFDLEGSNYLTEAGGNVFNWAFTFDSAAVTNVAVNNVSVTFSAYDFNGGVDDTSALTVDIVPYITGITTTQTNLGGIKAGNIRSVLGEYSIKDGNTADFITINGFNLNPITNGVRISGISYPSGLNGTVLQGTSLAVDSIAADYTSVVVSNNSTGSGFLNVVSGTVGAPVPSINNINSAQSYNDEPDTTRSLNTRRNDNRYVNFYTVSDTNIDGAIYPNMLMNGDTPYWGYIQSSDPNDLQLRRASNSGDSVAILRILAADQVAMAQDDGGRYHMATVNNFNLGRLVYFNHEFGSLYGDDGFTSPFWQWQGTENTRDNGNNAIQLEQVNYAPGLQLGRYVRPIIRTTGDSSTTHAKIFMLYYDNNAGDLIFRNFQVGQTVNNENHTLKGSFRSNLERENEAGRQIVSSNASSHFSMAVLPSNIVVLGYYDQSASQFVIRYSATTDGGTTAQALNANNPDTAVNWSAPINLPELYVGWYPSMVVDGSGRIHISAYDSGNASLSYAMLDAYNDTTPELVTVDTFNSVGYFSDIKLNGSGNPVIAYYNISETGTRDAIRLATYQDTIPTVNAGVDGSGYATGSWEVQTIPVDSVPQGSQSNFLKVNLGFDTSGRPVVGYQGDSLEYVIPMDEVP